MRTISFVSFLFLIFAYQALGQTSSDPAFAKYKVRVEKLKPVTVDLKSHKNARMYRTNLREAAKGGVNFAGHYTIATWGCGTNCTESGIIDQRNGRVSFPRELAGVGNGLAAWSEELDTLVFKPGSNLLIVNGLVGGSDLNYANPKQGIHYLLWNGSTLREVKFVKKPNN